MLEHFMDTTLKKIQIGIKANLLVSTNTYTKVS